MILDTFRHRGIKRFVFILFCIIVLFWKKIIVFPEINSIQPIIPIDTIFNLFVGNNVYLSAFVKILLLLICSYAFITVLSLHDVLPKRKYLAAMLFLCIISVLIDAQNIVGSVCALFFQLFAFYNLFRTYHSDRIKSAVFTSAFFAGISILFSFSFAVAIINLIIGIWIFSVITWRSIISMILGLLTPFVLLLYFFQLVYHDINLMLRSVENNFNNLSFSMFDFNNFSAFFMGFVFLVTLLSLLKASKYTKPIQRMINQQFYFIFITSAIITVFIFDMKSYGIMLFGISAAYLLTRFSQLVRRKWIAEFIVFAILIASVVYNNYLVSFYQ
ncbi:MAG: hypothetical protein LBC68_01605 [Prevotellaceae bacterium]|jgi:hypothetical protein|nr:hypothetical protein [Prevotellaceae bacterium]